MNPDGFTDRLTERGAEILKAANKVRREICLPLEEFFIALRASDNIPDMCRATYAFLQKSELEAKLFELARREQTRGDLKSADELASAYSIILKALADIGEALPNTSVTTEEFATILKTVFDKTEVGTIPTSIDEVTIGSASLLRSAQPNHVFVMGLCEGEFPANVDDCGLLSENDRATLSRLGFDLGADKDTRSSDELMFVRNAFSAPTQTLYLLTSAKTLGGDERTPSLPFRRVQSLFDIKPHRFYGNDLSFLSGSPRSAAAHLRSIEDAPSKLAVKKAVSEHIPAVGELSDASVTLNECRISPELVRSILGDTISISPSSLEKYVKCPFSYYASYMLSLREPKYGSFKANNFGSFVHYVLENMISYAIPSKGEESPSAEDIEKQTLAVIDSYIKMIAPDSAVNTKRMAHLYKRLYKLSLLLINNITKEFSDSDFRPFRPVSLFFQ
jgi:ATP-dependent helicase/nuclease subunit B